MCGPHSAAAATMIGTTIRFVGDESRLPAAGPPNAIPSFSSSSC
jgi:hypothetical protein